MISRVQELCRKLKPVLGKKIDRLWNVYLAESDPKGKAEIEQILEMLASKHLNQNYEHDRSPYPPPSETFAASGDIRLGKVTYGNREMYPFLLKSARLKEHLLVAGRSGSGKTNLTFVLMHGIMEKGIKVVALDWKRGYRDLMGLYPKLRVYTIGRDIAPFRFNPLIPPPGCEPNVWIKLIVDVIAGSYLGGEGVISLLVAGIDHLFRDAGVYDKMQTHWPTITDLLIWLRTAKLKGRAAMWQASAERILLAMTYGEFGSVLNTQNNCHIAELLDHNVVLEMDGLSSSSDKVMFSEALTLYLYRLRLAQGPQKQLTNVIVLEEAHNLLLKKASESKESMLETSIRMIRQYGMGYVFVDQSASLLSKVAFANSYATLALSQKLRSDIQTISGAMNLTDEQRDALSTLPIGSAVVRLADEHPEPFLVRIPLCQVKEGSVTDEMVKKQSRSYFTDSSSNRPLQTVNSAISPIPPFDKKKENDRNNLHHKDNSTHPPSPVESQSKIITFDNSKPKPPGRKMTREEIRFLADMADRPLSTTVSRYQRLNLSRRRGNAIRQSLAASGIIGAVSIPTRSGQVMLYQLTDIGRSVCEYVKIDPGPQPRASVEHRYWTRQTARHFEKKGYDITYEHSVKGNGAIDILAEKSGTKIAVEIETGKSDIKENLNKIKEAGFDKIVLVATSPAAITACQKAISSADQKIIPRIEQLTWLDIS